MSDVHPESGLSVINADHGWWSADKVFPVSQIRFHMLWYQVVKLLSLFLHRFALVCQQCLSHNGMALKEEFEYVGKSASLHPTPLSFAP